MAVIGLDCDGVLAEQNARFVECLREDYPEMEYTRDRITSRNPDIPEIDSDYVTELLRMRAERDDYYLGMEPVPGAVEAARRLARDHEVKVVTRRDAEFRHQTEAWLDRNGVPHVELVQPAPDNKADTGIDVLVDDHPPNVVEAARAGARAFWFVRRPHLHSQPLEAGETVADGDHAELAADPAVQWERLADAIGG